MAEIDDAFFYPTCSGTVEPANSDVEAAWEEEIVRRIAQAEAGKVLFVTKEEFFTHLRGVIATQRQP